MALHVGFILDYHMTLFTLHTTPVPGPVVSVQSCEVRQNFLTAWAGQVGGAGATVHLGVEVGSYVTLGICFKMIHQYNQN